MTLKWQFSVGTKEKTLMAKASSYLLLKRHRQCFTNDKMKEQKSFKISTEKPGGDFIKLFYHISKFYFRLSLKGYIYAYLFGYVLLNDSLLA